MPTTNAKLIPTSQKNQILKIVVRHKLDESPDTSHLGEYSRKSTSRFSIDRAHAEDCATQNPLTADAAKTLANARGTVAELQALEPNSDTKEWEALEDAYNLLDGLADEVTECDCGERGDMNRNEYRYFNPSFNYVDKDGNPSDGLTPEDVRKYTRQDYERMERLNRGDWSYMGILAEAEIGIPQVTRGTKAQPSYLLQSLHSGGLWGVESDSGTYIEETETDQLAELREVLLGFGFSRRAISKAFTNVEHKDA